MMTKKLLILSFILLPLAIWAQPNATIRAFKAEQLFVKGLTMAKTGNFRDAITVFDQVVDLDQSHPKVYGARGEMYYELKDYEKAVDNYLLAAEQNPQDAEVWNSAGVAAAKLGMYRAAASYFYEALEIRPEYKIAQDNYDKARKRIQTDDTSITDTEEWSPYASNQGRPNSKWNSSNRWDNDDLGLGSNPRPIGGNNSSDNGSIWSRPPRNSSGRPNSNRPIEDDFGTDIEDNVDERSDLQEYRYSEIEVGNQSDMYISIDQVHVTKNATLVSITIKSIGSRSFPLKLGSGGSSEAWYITSRDFKRNFKLRNIKNLPGWPNQPYTLKPGEEKLIIAEFQRIDGDIFYFHLLEGKTPKEGSWNFYDVKLNKDI